VFTLAAIRVWGYLAVVLGMAAGLIVSSAVFMPLVQQRIGVPACQMFHECLKLPLMVAAASSAIVPSSGMLELCTSFVRVLAIVPAYWLLHGLALLALGLPSEEDRRVFDRYSPFKRIQGFR
jgi:hypothetical protein